MTREYPLHKAARTANNVVGVLCCVLIVGIPLGIWVFMRNAAAKVLLTDSGVKASGVFGSTSFTYSEVRRLGLVKVAVAGRGAAGELAKAKVGGDHATHIIAKTASDKNRSFLVSSYENWQEIIEEIGARVGKPYETLEPHGAGGVYGAKWPQA